MIVQFILIFNTYELKDRQFNESGKYLINELYTSSIRNDKLFPGGNQILDRYIINNMPLFEELYSSNRPAFHVFRQNICNNLFAELRKKNTMDSVFLRIIYKNNLRKDLLYLLTIESLNITFNGVEYIPLYNKKERYPLINSEFQSPNGIVIGGRLKMPNLKSRVTDLSVSSASPYSYHINFCLYVDRHNRYKHVFIEMLPTFILAFFAIFSVLLIYYITFRNWVKQKKLAEMKSDFVNSITHEFHTPISTIMVANKSLQMEKITSKKENIANLTAVIERQTKRLQELFDQVLDITTINKENLEKQEYDLHDLLEELLLDYRLKHTGEKVELRFSQGRNVETKISLNKFWFTTMLYNIFNNAVKYNNKISKEIEVRTSFQNNGITIHIKDNGIGMHQNAVKHIYDKFFRGNKNKMNSVPGLGLGLFYAKQCIDAHGWNLSVYSEEEVGSEFVIHIGKG